MERITVFEPAYDKRHTTPGRNYGVHGVVLRMVLKGERGAVQFVLYTNWQLPHVAEEFAHRDFFNKPLPADKGYHSPKPMYEDQSTTSDACEYLDGKPCYYDGSGLNAVETYEILLREGDAGVWADLEAFYKDTFGHKPHGL